MPSISHSAQAHQAHQAQQKHHKPPTEKARREASADTCAQARVARDEVAQSAVGAGLVCSETKGTSPTYHLLNPQQIRLRRLRRAVVTASRLQQETLTGSKVRFRVAMLTLTYAECDAWRPQHIKELLRHLRQYLKRRGHAFRYVWVAELQERGAVHYHVVIWLPRGVTLPKPDKRGWWCHGSTRIEWARKPVSYLAKYASKVQSKGGEMPSGARLYGIGGLDRQDRYERAWWMLPKYIREHSPEPRDNGPAKRAKGGGWLTPFGEWFPSRYIIKTFNPLTIVEREGWNLLAGVTA